MSSDKSENVLESLEEQMKKILDNAGFTFVKADKSSIRTDNDPKPPAENDTKNGEKVIKAIENFSLKPKDIRDYLDRFVIRQNDAKKVLSVAICDHYNHVRQCLVDENLRNKDFSKHNILLLGPTGVGKTYIVKCLARLIGVPFVKADATKFSETGYVGHDVEDLVRDLVKVADGNVDLAQYGIIFIDEIDKIASSESRGGKDVSGRGVQVNLLKLMEETEVSLFSQTDILGQMQAVMDMQRGKKVANKTINTRHILFIVSGAFGTLAEQVKKRVSASAIGFAGNVEDKDDNSDFLRMAATSDFVKYGFEPEFIGRLPVRVVCNPLNTDDLELIMKKAEGNILEQYVSDFRGYNIDLSITDSAIRAIAENAFKENTGARGLSTILERVFREYKFELPSTGIKEFVLEDDAVKSPETALQELLKKKEPERRQVLNDEIDDFIKKFYEQHSIKLSINNAARNNIITRCLNENITAARWLENNFNDFEYAFNLLANLTGKKTFSITGKMVDNPEKELSMRIARASERKE